MIGLSTGSEYFDMFSRFAQYRNVSDRACPTDGRTDEIALCTALHADADKIGECS